MKSFSIFSAAFSCASCKIASCNACCPKSGMHAAAKRCWGGSQAHRVLPLLLPKLCLSNSKCLYLPIGKNFLLCLAESLSKIGDGSPEGRVRGYRIRVLSKVGHQGCKPFLSLGLQGSHSGQIFTECLLKMPVKFMPGAVRSLSASATFQNLLPGLHAKL